MKNRIVPKRDYGERNIAFSPANVAHMQAGLKDDLIGNSILLMIGCGLRPGEVIALCRSDISPDGGKINVSTSALSQGTVHAKSCRVVTVRGEYWQMVARHLRARGKSENEYIWKGDDPDKTISLSEFRRLYYDALNDIGDVPHMSLHACRNTYFTLFSAKNE